MEFKLGENGKKSEDVVTNEATIVMQHKNFNTPAAPAVAAEPPALLRNTLIDAEDAKVGATMPSSDSVAYFYCPTLPSMKMHIPARNGSGIMKTIEFKNGAYATSNPAEIALIEITMQTSPQLIQRTTHEQYERTTAANQGIDATMFTSARKNANSDAVRGVRNHNYMEQRAAAAGITPTEEQRKQYAEATRAGDFGGTFSSGSPAASRK